MYCGNNPVKRYDPTGFAFDTVLDVGFICWDIYDLFVDEGYKDWKNWASLGLDVVFSVVPFVTGGGKAIKLANVGDDLHDLSKVTVVGETMTRVQTVAQFVNAADNLYDGFSAYKKLSSLGKGGTRSRGDWRKSIKYCVALWKVTAGLYHCRYRN